MLILLTSACGLAACNKVTAIEIAENNMPQLTFVQGEELDLSKGVLTVTDKEGKNRTAFEVVANNVQFVESKRDGGAPAAGEAPVGFSNASANEFVEIGGADDDLPF